MNSYYKQNFFLKRVQVKAKDFIKQKKKRNQTEKVKESKEKSTLQRMPL